MATIKKEKTPRTLTIDLSFVDMMKERISKVREIERKWLPAGIIGVAIVIVLLVAWRVAARTATPAKIPGGTADSRVAIKGARASVTVNKELVFPIRDQYGKEITKIKYFLESAQLQDEIIVKGQSYVAVKGRTFLILNIKLTNDFDKTINLNARDYTRLTVTGKEDEKLAADIHNDPVELQAISTKETRLGWPVDDNVKKYTLYVGEIDGDKQKVDLKF